MRDRQDPVGSNYRILPVSRKSFRKDPAVSEMNSSSRALLRRDAERFRIGFPAARSRPRCHVKMALLVCCALVLCIDHAACAVVDAERAQAAFEEGHSLHQGLLQPQNDPDLQSRFIQVFLLHPLSVASLDPAAIASTLVQLAVPFVECHLVCFP